MIIFTPEKYHYPEIAEIFNLSIKRYLDIYTEEEKAYFILEETPETIEDLHSRKSILAVSNNDVVIGYLVYTIKNDYCMWISSIYIHPKFQRKNFGKILLDEAEKIATEKGILIVALETHQRATWAINFYKKNGYKIIVDDLLEFPFSKVLQGKAVPNRPLLGKLINYRQFVPQNS